MYDDPFIVWLCLSCAIKVISIFVDLGSLLYRPGFLLVLPERPFARQPSISPRRTRLLEAWLWRKKVSSTCTSISDNWRLWSLLCYANISLECTVYVEPIAIIYAYITQCILQTSTVPLSDLLPPLRLQRTCHALQKLYMHLGLCPFNTILQSQILLLACFNTATEETLIAPHLAAQWRSGYFGLLKCLVSRDR